MNEAQLPEVTNVPNDLCPARVALFLPAYNSPRGQWWWWWWCKSPGLLYADAQTASLQTLTNGLCETTAIDIYLISPCPNTVSTMSRLAIILQVFCFFFQAQVWVMPGAPSLASPKGPPIGAPGQRREREKVRGRWRGEKVKLKASGIVKKHTLLCVFTCLLDELSFSLHGQKKKRHMFFYPPVLGHKTPSNTVLLTSFNT